VSLRKFPRLLVHLLFNLFAGNFEVLSRESVVREDKLVGGGRGRQFEFCQEGKEVVINSEQRTFGAGGET
jgi:hypothetical protein